MTYVSRLHIENDKTTFIYYLFILKNMPRKKILLISPKNPLSDRTSLPPLGLLTLASHIPSDYEVEFIDENKQKIVFDADIVFISANSLTIRNAYQLCEEFKRRNIPVILGGIHASLMPNEAKKYATSVVIGNGEGILKEIILDFEKGKLKKVYDPGFFDLSKSKIPRRDLLKKKYILDSLETSRGCPFDCEFCSVTQVNGAAYRYKPLEFVRKELDSIKKKNIFLVDDNFLGAGKKAEKRAYDLLQLLKEYNISWLGQTSLNIGKKPRLLKLAQESGAIMFYMGFESLNENFLKSANKQVNLKLGVSSYKKIIKLIHDYGINIMGSFMYGTDYDTKKSLYGLMDFVVDTNIDTTVIKPLTPLPGTRLYWKYKKAKRLFNDQYWLENPYPIFTFKPKNLGMDELYDISMDFLNLYTIPKSTKYFIKSLISTQNLKGSFISYLNNIGGNSNYKKYAKKYSLDKNYYSQL